MTALTDADRAIRKAPRYMRDTPEGRAALEAIYRAGLAAGRAQMREEAARAAENVTGQWPIFNEQREQCAKDCAAAIRKLP